MLKLKSNVHFSIPYEQLNKNYLYGEVQSQWKCDLQLYSIVKFLIIYFWSFSEQLKAKKVHYMDTCAHDTVYLTTSQIS